MVPIEAGKQPVMIAERAGAHTGAAANALSNRTPSAAKLSRLGVLAYSAQGQTPR